MAIWSVQALLFLDMKNIRYLTGFSGSDGALLMGTDFRMLLVDGRYITQAGQEAPGFEIRRYAGKIEGLADVMAGLGPCAVGFEAETMSVSTWVALKERLPVPALQPLQEELEGLRSVKDGEEISKISKAASIASLAFESVLCGIAPGRTELEIAMELDHAMRRGGAQEASFQTIVASGENSSRPHARPQDRAIRAGDLITIDFGAVFDGYRSDETCTCVLGKPDARQHQVHQIVRDAHDRAIEAIRPGVSCRAIDEAARSWIEKQGYGEFFTHGTGHGVGLDVHEYPRLTIQSQAVLEAGMVVTVEPGIYLPGLWGIRIEDLVVVQQDGCAILSTTPKDLIMIET
jgi:Xaa-Pro aminopeptidase/Xaa-Pro dipeptidase